MSVATDDIDFAVEDIPNLHELLAQYRRSSPAAPVTFYGFPARLVTRHHDVAAVFRNEDEIPSAAAYSLHSQPVMGKTIQCMVGEEHRVNRALVSPAFRSRVVADYIEPVLEPVTNDLIDRMASQDEVDLVTAFTKQLPFSVITRLLGIPARHDGDFQRWALGLISYPSDPEGALAASAEFTKYLRPLVAERRAEPGEDLLSLLATAEVEGSILTDEEIFSFVRLLFPAGADTTYLGLGNILVALLTHPEVLERCRAKPAVIPDLIEEGLRWESPVAVLPRFAPRDVEIGGELVPAQTPLLVAITAANRDPDLYSDPDHFDIDRRPTNTMTFGLGVHFCLGSHLARRELEVAMRTLIERLEHVELVGEARIKGTVLRGPGSIPVRARVA